MQHSKTIFLGVMSGTSLDGLDLCLCSISEVKEKIEYNIIDCTTIKYPKHIITQLSNCHNFTVEDFLLFNNEYGVFIGESCKKFLKNKDKPIAIASHGHTIFHQPDRKFTYQIGAGASIMAESGIDTICDFRSSDVAFGGQGAPLVPIGDKLLFSEYDYCINIGGFANIFGNNDSSFPAFDICAANFVLNELAMTLGKEFDESGNIARNSKVDKKLLTQLNSLIFYTKLPPKSLGREWVEEIIWPILKTSNISVPDKIATYTEHIAFQIGNELAVKNKKALVTGGGAFNSHLIERIQHYSNATIILPDKTIINFKEALIFALLGYLYLNNKNNCIANITGANTSSIGGTLYKYPHCIL